MNFFSAITIAALGVVIYAYAGYPVLIALWRKVSVKPVNKRRVDVAVTILLPVYNEAAIIKKRLDNLTRLDFPKEKLQIIVVNDGSTDATGELVRNSEVPLVDYLQFDVRKGKSAALNYAAENATGDILLLTDARAVFDQDVLYTLLSNFADESVGAVTGAYMVKDSGGIGTSENLYWQYESWIKSNESCLHSTCAVSGSILAIRRRLYRGIPPQIINDDAYINLDVIRQGFRVVYEKAAKCSQVASKTMGDDRLRRRRITAGRYQLCMMPRIWPWKNLTALFCYISHKFLRLYLGLFMLLALIANVVSVLFYPSSAVINILLLAQIVFYVFAAAGFAGVRMPGRVDKLTKAAWFLVSGNLASLQGFVGYAFGTQTVLWKKAQKHS